MTIKYDYYVTSLQDTNDKLERYLFDNVHDFRFYIANAFYSSSDADQKAAKSDFDVMDKNIETPAWETAIKKLCKQLYDNEVNTISFSFTVHNEVHNLDVLVINDEEGN